MTPAVALAWVIACTSVAPAASSAEEGPTLRVGGTRGRIALGTACILTAKVADERRSASNRGGGETVAKRLRLP